MKQLITRSWDDTHKKFSFLNFKDKNNKEIYEGDIIKIILDDYNHPKINAESDDYYTHYTPKVENICEVRFRKSSGWIALVRQGKYKGKALKLKDKHDEVIGNIYQNPKLINPQKQNHPITNVFLE